jgi:hypothetical protein
MSIALGLSKIQQQNLQDLILRLLHQTNGQCVGTATTAKIAAPLATEKAHGVDPTGRI